MKKDQPQGSADHEFANLGEFDRAMRKIAQVPKDVVEEAERKSHTPRKAPAKRMRRAP